MSRRQSAPAARLRRLFIGRTGGETFNRSFGCYISEIVANPDYILQDERPATAMVLKEFFDTEKSECFRLALRLIAVSEAVDLKNSVINFIKVRKKEYNRLLRNKKILYKHE